MKRPWVPRWAFKRFFLSLKHTDGRVPWLLHACLPFLPRKERFAAWSAFPRQALTHAWPTPHRDQPPALASPRAWETCCDQQLRQDLSLSTRFSGEGEEAHKEFISLVHPQSLSWVPHKERRLNHITGQYMLLEQKHPGSTLAMVITNSIWQQQTAQLATDWLEWLVVSNPEIQDSGPTHVPRMPPLLGLPQLKPSGSHNTTLESNQLSTALLAGSDTQQTPHKLCTELKDSLTFPWDGCGWLSWSLSLLAPMKPLWAASAQTPRSENICSVLLQRVPTVQGWAALSV